MRLRSVQARHRANAECAKAGDEGSMLHAGDGNTVVASLSNHELAFDEYLLGETLILRQAQDER